MSTQEDRQWDPLALKIWSHLSDALRALDKVDALLTPTGATGQMVVPRPTESIREAMGAWIVEIKLAHEKEAVDA